MHLVKADAHFHRENVSSSKTSRIILVPPEGKAALIAPSLDSKKRGIGTDNSAANGEGGDKLPFPYATEGEPDNPTVVPHSLLEKFHFTFLIRDPAFQHSLVVSMHCPSSCGRHRLLRFLP